MQTINYYRFWLLMVGAVCIASISPVIAVLIGLGAVGLGLVLPIFSKQIMAMGSKIETSVNKKVEKKTEDKKPETNSGDNRNEADDKTDAA